MDFDLHDFALSSWQRAIMQVQQSAQRDSFVAGHFVEDDVTKSWTMQVHSLLLRQAASSQLLWALDGQDSFALEEGPTTEFLIGSSGVARIEIDFSGEAIDACQCLWDMIDLDVDVHTTVYFTLTAPDAIHGEMQIEFDLSKIEVVCCAITASLLWFMVAQSWIDHDHMSGEQGVGATMAQIYYGPIAIAIPFLAMVHGQAASHFDPGGPWTKTSPGEDDPLVYERDWQVHFDDLGFGAMSMTEMHGVNDSSTQGLSMSGTLAQAREHDDPHLAASADTEFAVSFGDPCGVDPQLQAEWNAYFQSAPVTDGHLPTPIQVFGVSVIESTDSVHQFGPYLEYDNQSAWIYVPLSGLKASYTGYSSKLLVVTSGGVRIITIPPLPHWTAQQVADATTLHDYWRVTHCTDWGFLGDPFWGGGHYNPKWSVDPGPEDTVLQVWDVGIRGLTAGRALRIETAAGAVLQTVQVTESGGAAWSGVVDGGTSLSMYTFAAGHAGGQSVPSMPSVASVASSMPSVASIPSIPSMRSVAQAPSAAQGAYAPPPKLTLANLESTLARLKAEAGGRVIEQPKRDEAKGIDIRQRALHPLVRLGAPWGVEALLPTRWNDARALVVADGRGATLWALERPEMPRRIARHAMHDLRRAFAWRGQAWLAGDGRVVPLHGAAPATPGCCGEAVVDADASGTHRFTLTSRALWHSDDPDAPDTWVLDVAQATRLAVHHESLALADEDGVIIYPRRAGRLAGPLQRIALRGVTRLETCEGPGDSYWARDADGRRWRISMSDSRVWLSAQADPPSPRQLMVRWGALLAVADQGGPSVTMGRLGGTRLLRR